MSKLREFFFSFLFFLKKNHLTPHAGWTPRQGVALTQYPRGKPHE